MTIFKALFGADLVLAGDTQRNAFAGSRVRATGHIGHAKVGFSAVITAFFAVAKALLSDFLFTGDRNATGRVGAARGVIAGKGSAFLTFTAFAGNTGVTRDIALTFVGVVLVFFVVGTDRFTFGHCAVVVVVVIIIGCVRVFIAGIHRYDEGKGDANGEEQVSGKLEHKSSLWVAGLLYGADFVRFDLAKGGGKVAMGRGSRLEAGTIVSSSRIYLENRYVFPRQHSGW